MYKFNYVQKDKITVGWYFGIHQALINIVINIYSR